MASSINDNKIKELDKLSQQLKALLEDALKSKKAGQQHNLQDCRDKGTELLLEMKHLSDFSKEEETQSNKLQEQRIRLQPLDSQLENLRYEQDCYASEIEQCRQYGFDDLTQILHGENADAPKSNIQEQRHITESSIINEEDHRQMLSALNFKLMEKIRLAKEIENLNQQKAQLKETVSSSKKKLDSLDSKLKVLAKNSTLFQQYITPTTTKQNKISPAAATLPTPLFLIYRQAVNYADYFESDIEVVINGDIPTDNTQITNPTTPFPLSLTIKFPTLSYFSVKFSYYPQLNVLTAFTPANAHVLNNIFSNANYVSFPSFTSGEVHVEEIEGKPFKWVQELGRIDHLSSEIMMSDDKSPHISFHNFIKQIKSSLG